MGPASFSYLTGALRRNKTTPVPPPISKNDGKDYKAQHILGISEADINTVRNQSLSSNWSAKLANSFSDATTEFGTSVTPGNMVDEGHPLRLKASSTLLRDESFHDAATTNSSFSRGVRHCGSSSTLHSFYDRQKQPLAISQQTSDSSRRDFALRKGLPMVVETVTPEQDSRLQLKFFKSPKSRSRANSKKSTNTITGSIHTASQVSLRQRPTTSSKKEPFPDVSVSSRSIIAPSEASSKHQTTIRNSPSRAADNHLLDEFPINKLQGPLVGTQVKVHVRRPKAGAKNWFDGMYENTSDEERVKEPVLRRDFADGSQSALQNDIIPKPSDMAPMKSQDTVSSHGSEDTSSTPRNSKFCVPVLPPITKVPQNFTLNAKASKSNISRSSLRSRASKEKASPLTTANLHQDSVLDLSSSDDEDEENTVHFVEQIIEQSTMRDSLASEFTAGSEAEIGIARTIDAKQNLQSLPRFKSSQANDSLMSNQRPPTAIPLRKSSRMLSYLSDQSSEAVGEANELQPSVSVTPIDTLSSCRGSVLSSVYVPDDASFESRRLMSVTRQEESLLAAMRLKRATMKYHSAHKSQGDLSNDDNSDASYSASHLDSASFLNLDPQSIAEQIDQVASQRSTSVDVSVPSRDSYSTFQSEAPHLPHPRFSNLGIATDFSKPSLTRQSLSSPLSFEHSTSPSLLSIGNTEGRASRGTHFSTSTAGSRSQSRTISRGSHVVALDGLHQGPQRDEIRSQDFISWPYKGWDARAKLTVAH